MPYSLIKGTFHIYYPENPKSGPEPDGDTIKFKPANRMLVEKLPRQNAPAKYNNAGITTIRLEGVDALETHFSIEGDEFRQRIDLALAARDFLLSEMGFGQIQYFIDPEFKVEQVENHPVNGYILSNGLDTYGRVIAFIYTGTNPAADGSTIYLTPQMLDDSLNARLLSSGNAYASFYLTLPAELRERLKQLTLDARDKSTGLWQNATVTTSKRAVIQNLDQLQQLVIWPKLFRRLAAYFQSGYDGLDRLQQWIREDKVNRDDRLILPNSELGNMHDLLIIDGDTLRMAYEPEEVVIVPDDYVLNPAPVPGPPAMQKAGIRIVAALINPSGGQERGLESVTVINTLATDTNLDGLFIADKQSKQALSGNLKSGETLRVKLSSTLRLNNIRGTITIIDEEENISDVANYDSKDLPPEGHTMIFPHN